MTSIQNILTNQINQTLQTNQNNQTIQTIKTILLFLATAFISILIFSSDVLANDTALGGSGATPFPIEHDDIKMLSEHIIMRGQDLTRTDHEGYWLLRCEYNFKNLSNQLQTLKMGFPFPVKEKEEIVSVPAGKSISDGGSLIHDFKLIIDGKIIPAKQIKIAPQLAKGLNYSNAFSWDLQFAPAQTMQIEHRYMTGQTYNVLGQTLVHYVLKTGALWHGKTIDEARIEIYPNTPTRLCSEVDPADMVVKTTPNGIQIKGWKSERMYFWNLIQFSPTDDLQLCLYTGKDYVRYKILFPFLQMDNQTKKKLESMSLQDLNLLKNTVYAQYGRKFINPTLQNYFQNQWWYQENPNYNEQLLTPEDKTILNTIYKIQLKPKNIVSYLKMLTVDFIQQFV